MKTFLTFIFLTLAYFAGLTACFGLIYVAHFPPLYVGVVPLLIATGVMLSSLPRRLEKAEPYVSVFLLSMPIYVVTFASTLFGRWVYPVWWGETALLLGWVTYQAHIARAPLHAGK